ANGLGTPGAHGLRRSCTPRGGARCAVSRADPDRSGFLGRRKIYGDRISAGLLSTLSRLPEILSALGARALCQPDERQNIQRAVWNVVVSGLKDQCGLSERH